MSTVLSHAGRQVFEGDLHVAGVGVCRAKFLAYFPEAFRDKTYLARERDGTWAAHESWVEVLGQSAFRLRLRKQDFAEIAVDAIRVEAQTTLLCPLEKMAIRDAIRTETGARTFSLGLYDFVHGPGNLKHRFSRWVDAISELPRRQTRLLTWPILTAFAFIADPAHQIVLKPNVIRTAAREYGFAFHFDSRPTWETYSSLLEFADTIHHDLRDLRPRDMIDIHSFIRAQASDEPPYGH